MMVEVAADRHCVLHFYLSRELPASLTNYLALSQAQYLPETLAIRLLKSCLARLLKSCHLRLLSLSYPSHVQNSTDIKSLVVILETIPLFQSSLNERYFAKSSPTLQKTYIL